MENWSNVCNDILELIVDQLSEMGDIVRFGVVCQQWRSVSVEKMHLFTIAEPWLMLVENEDNDNRDFCDMSTQKVYRLNLPEARGRSCLSSNGWLITFGDDREIHLLNPFSREQIRLPPQPTLPYQWPDGTKLPYLRWTCLWKIVLTSRPSHSAKGTRDKEDEKCVVMAIVSGQRILAFLRLGDKVWTLVEGEKNVGISDIIFLNGQFYAVANNGRLMIVDISSPHPKQIRFAERPDDINRCATFYLVESVGELFLVAQAIDYGDKTTSYDFHETNYFDVYKFSFDNREWMRMVSSLDNRAFFVGFNSSFAMFPSKHSRYEPNCIYYSDVNMAGHLSATGTGKDLGVFRVEADEVEDLYTGPGICSRVWPSVWLCPSP